LDRAPASSLKGSVVGARKSPQASLCLTLEDKEALLEELADWVTSIDNARGGAEGALPPVGACALLAEPSSIELLGPACVSFALLTI